MNFSRLRTKPSLHVCCCFNDVYHGEKILLSSQWKSYASPVSAKTFPEFAQNLTQNLIFYGENKSGRFRFRFHWKSYSQLWYVAVCLKNILSEFHHTFFPPLKSFRSFFLETSGFHQAVELLWWSRVYFTGSWICCL